MTAAAGTLENVAAVVTEERAKSPEDQVLSAWTRVCMCVLMMKRVSKYAMNEARQQQVARACVSCLYVPTPMFDIRNTGSSPSIG